MSEVRSGSPDGNVLELYNLILELKDLIRSGWLRWNVPANRLESVAEHVYSTMIIAISMKSEFDYSVNIDKVLKMLLVHEFEEILIGDITPVDGISEEEKRDRGHKAVLKILRVLTDGDEYKKIIFEFDERKTPEARFAYQCDKLDADLMAFRYYKIYGNDCYMIPDKIKNNCLFLELYKKGSRTIAEFFYYFDIDKFDDNFKAVLNREFASCTK